MDEFNWKNMTICFPEFFSGIDSNGYPDQPRFMERKIEFRLNKEYGIELYLNQEIPKWIKGINEIDQETIKNKYKELSEKVYEDVSFDLNQSLEIFENWRNFILKFDKSKGWIGNLQSHIEFSNELNQVYYPDYYSYYLKEKSLSPTDVLLRINKIPQEGLNHTWKRYWDISKDVFSRNGNESCNFIKGKNLIECIRNADNIYKVAPEIKSLDFQF